MRTLFKTCALAALFAAGSGALQAQAGTEAETGAASDTGGVPAAMHMQMTVDDALNGAMEGALTPIQITMLKNMAHQIAVSESCEGFEIDQELFASEMHLIHYDEAGKQLDLTQAELNTLEKKALLGLGMAMGSQMAVAAYDVASYCTAAEEERAALASDDAAHTIWKTPS